MPADSPAAVVLDEAAVKRAIADALAEALDRLEAARVEVPERMAFSEPEAARLIGLNVHQLKGERHRGRIVGSLVVGRRVRYTRADLVGYLMKSRTNDAA